MVPPEHINSTPDTNIPQIHFDQMTIMAHQHHAAKHDTPPWSDPHNTPPVSDSNIFAAMDRGQIKPRLTRAFLKRQSDWMDWALSEFKQLNQYHAQGMFGDPTRCLPQCNVLPLIWTYLIKSDGTKKARCVRNGTLHTVDSLPSPKPMSPPSTNPVYVRSGLSPLSTTTNVWGRCNQCLC